VKKLTAILLALLLACTPLIGCDKEQTKVDPNGNETTQHGTTETDDYDHVETKQGFSMKGEKYPYQNNDVLILDVENTTDTHYTAILTVTFYNEAGEAIKTQEKTIEQFPAKYKQPCLFQPNLQFASYTCEISLEEYTGPDYLSTLTSEKHTTKVQRLANKPTGRPNERETFITVRLESSFGPCTIVPDGKFLFVTYDVVVFDNIGKIYTITQNGLKFGNTDTITSDSNDIILISSTENLDMPIPEELKGEVTVMLFPVGFKFIDDPFYKG